MSKRAFDARLRGRAVQQAADEGRIPQQSGPQSIPQGLKPIRSAAFSARLKSCPFKAAGFALACLSVAAVVGSSLAWAQADAAFPHSTQMLAKSSMAPGYSIPLEPLGFTAPSPYYLGQMYSTASLDFLDENRLLFTFRVSGLISRDAGNDATREERHIRAVVLALPGGTLLAEDVWTLHDRDRYLWMLKNGHFLLRDGDGLQLGDATLAMEPSLRFPGPLLTVQLDPDQQFLVTNSREPAQSKPETGTVPSPATAAADIVSDDKQSVAQPDYVVRILHREPADVMLFSRVRSAVHLEINGEGFLETLRGRGRDWLVNLNFFRGGSKPLANVDSTCSPSSAFVSQQEVLISACNAQGGRRLAALSTDGRRFWETTTPATEIWPQLVMAPNGLRLARETLVVPHAVGPMNPISWDDVKGQLVKVYDAADGKVALTTPASPVMDAGGNVAISPSGRRVAVIHGGAIEVYELPAAPALPDAATVNAR
jgi:hypothetical protein